MARPRIYDLPDDPEADAKLPPAGCKVKELKELYAFSEEESDESLSSIIRKAVNLYISTMRAMRPAKEEAARAIATGVLPAPAQPKRRKTA